MIWGGGVPFLTSPKEGRSQYLMIRERRQTTLMNTRGVLNDSVQGDRAKSHQIPQFSEVYN